MTTNKILSDQTTALRC